jgi:uncharacterized protein
LKNNDYRPIPGWSILLFLAVTLPLALTAGYFLAGRGMLPLLSAFFLVGGLAALAAVAPMGGAALPALGFRWVGWRPMLLGAVGTMALSIIVSQLGPSPEGIKDAMKVVQEPRFFLVSLLVLAVLAPVVEELIFRGLLYGWLEGRWGPRMAVAVSTVAFAAAHIEPAHVVLVLPLGLLFGWLRWRTDSILPSLFSHVANNGMAVIAGAMTGV